MAKASTTEMELGGFLAAGSGAYGKPFLDACDTSLALWEQLAEGYRDQAGQKIERQTPAQIIPRMLFLALRRFEGMASDWPVNGTPIPEVVTESCTSRREQVADILHNFLLRCQHARHTGLELVLADRRSYVRAGAIDGATDRLEQLFDALLESPRLTPDAEVMVLREQVRCYEIQLSRAREQGYKPLIYEHECLAVAS